MKFSLDRNMRMPDLFIGLDNEHSLKKFGQVLFRDGFMSNILYRPINLSKLKHCQTFDYNETLTNT